MRCIGLMSGTSMDAVDAALARFDDRLPAPGFVCEGLASRPMPAALRADLSALQAPGPDELARAARAANALADLYADTVADLLRTARVRVGDVAAIGAHGQTVRHRPDQGWTIQINAPARLAERSGIAVVADLRSRDVAAGGQGAPLVPPFHARAFGDVRERRVVVNLGGIANVSVLVPGEPPRGWDCGPANVLMDGWCERHLNRAYDADGRWAASGQVLPGLLATLMAEPWLAEPPPKSTGRDLFNLGWLDARIAQAAARNPAGRDAAPADVQATLLEYTVRTVAQACTAGAPDRVLLCGGGAANAALVDRLAALMAPVPVAASDTAGVPAQAVEALAFAWLAHEHLAGRPANVPEVTGARGPRVLGALYPA